MPCEWDDAKAKAGANVVKHGVSFEEAETVFDDPLAALLEDVFHSDNESRSLIIGYSDRGRLLFVCYTERGETVCLISARLATGKEREKHERQINFG